MRFRPYLPLLLAACAKAPDAEARLAARRISLGLPSEPLPLAEAMRQMGVKAYEALLARVGSRRLTEEEVLDAAVEIETLLARAVGPPDPPGFDPLLARSRTLARALALAVAQGKRGDAEARELLASCMDCHVIFRKPR